MKQWYENRVIMENECKNGSPAEGPAVRLAQKVLLYFRPYLCVPWINVGKRKCSCGSKNQRRKAPEKPQAEELRQEP